MEYATPARQKASDEPRPSAFFARLHVGCKKRPEWQRRCKSTLGGGGGSSSSSPTQWHWHDRHEYEPAQT